MERMDRMDRWYVARSKPHKELVLAGFLDSLGVETYYPMIRRRDRANTSKVEGLFPGYLFCHMDIEAREWPQIRWAIGLSHFLSADGRPSAVPDDLVEYIKQRTYLWNNDAPEVRFDPGSRVTIASGPFAGLAGVFQQYMSSRQRCKVLLETVNGLMAVEMEASRLRTAVPARLEL